MLNIQVGTQSISPLIWSIEIGSLDAAKAIIQDLLTIRADRERYYYGMDTCLSVMQMSSRSCAATHATCFPSSSIWDNVERMLKNPMGQPAIQENALTKCVDIWDEKSQNYVRREVYVAFFAIAPAGQDYFKQSTTMLHFIADKVVIMTSDMFKDPKRRRNGSRRLACGTLALASPQTSSVLSSQVALRSF